MASLALLCCWLGSVACTKTDSSATSSVSSVHPKNGALASSDAQDADLVDDVPGVPCAVNPALTAEEWVQVVGRSCYRGSEQHGKPRVMSITRDRPSSIELPLEIRNRCWILAVAAESNASEVHFDLVDSSGEMHPLGELHGRHALLPAGGPFCSLRGEIRSLAAKTSRDVSAVFRVAWYSYASQP